MKKYFIVFAFVFKITSIYAVVSSQWASETPTRWPDAWQATGKLVNVSDQLSTAGHSGYYYLTWNQTSSISDAEKNECCD